MTTASYGSRVLAGPLAVVLACAGLGAQELPPEVTRAQFDAWMTELSNRGRWGDDDQLGVLNLVTPAKRVEAAKLVRTGQVVSMARPIELQVLDDPDATSANRKPVLMGAVRNVFDIDAANSYFWKRYEVEYHGLPVSHLDALSHVAYEGKVYNGRAFEEVATVEGGCTAMGVINAKDGLAARSRAWPSPSTSSCSSPSASTCSTTSASRTWPGPRASWAAGSFSSPRRPTRCRTAPGRR